MGVSSRVAIALVLAGALVTLVALTWATLAPEARAGVGAVMAGMILLLLGVHRGGDR